MSTSTSTKKIHIETYGCAFNAADAETMAGLLGEAGYELADHAENADLIVLNTCTVKDRTWREFEKRLAALKAAAAGGGPRIVVAGCAPKVSTNGLLEGVSALGPDTLDRVAEVVAATLDGRVMQCVRVGDRAAAAQQRTQLPARRRNPVIEILPIARGCLSACTFCQTRLARGRLVSFRPAGLVERARRAIGEGARELWLTAQDTGAYGADCGHPLPRLLERLCALEGDFTIRLGMSSPAWIDERLEEYLAILRHPKMFQFLHVPVQSGSDRILRAMGRQGDAAQFLRIAEAFHAALPDGALMTDAIAGFPGEEEKDFAATLELLERAAPAMVNRSRFSPRPGTAAARLKPVMAAVIGERSGRLNELARGLARAYHRRWIGKTDRVLIAESPRADSVVAHNRAWSTVDLAGAWPLGQWVDVVYNGAADYHLKARSSGVPPSGGA